MPDIKKLREICEKASPGPWNAVVSRTAVGVCYRIFPESWGKVPDHGGICAYDDYTSLNPHPKGEQAANAQFIAAARTALPELLDEVERLRKALHLACVMIDNQFDTCPLDMHEWEGCLHDSCQNEMAECCQRYFLEKVKGKRDDNLRV